jgi:hypothetical protein
VLICSTRLNSNPGSATAYKHRAPSGRGWNGRSEGKASIRADHAPHPRSGCRKPGVILQFFDFLEFYLQILDNHFIPVFLFNFHMCCFFD